MADQTDEANRDALRLDFDRRLLLQFRGSAITSDAGLLPCRELDDAVGLTDTAANTLADACTRKNIRHLLGGLPRHFGCICYHPLFVFNQLGDVERGGLRSGNVHSADGWRAVMEPV